jgi:homoserine O-acetyltransferase
MTFEQNKLPCSYFTEKKPLLLENGTSIDELTVAYESYGKLNKEKSNAIIVCHALSGDQFVASKNPITQKKWLVGQNGWFRKTN